MVTKLLPRDTILIDDDENMAKKFYTHQGWRKYGQEILFSLRVTNIWPRDTILVEGEEYMAKRYYSRWGWRIYGQEILSSLRWRNMAKRYYPR